MNISIGAYPCCMRRTGAAAASTGQPMFSHDMRSVIPRAVPAGMEAQSDG